MSEVLKWSDECRDTDSVPCCRLAKRGERHWTGQCGGHQWRCSGSSVHGVTGTRAQVGYVRWKMGGGELRTEITPDEREGWRSVDVDGRRSEAA